MDFFLKPAVSISLKLLPKYLTYESTESLVVPAMLVTIDFSSSKILFINDDFPTFGIPIIAKEI